ncbi:type II secretion system protein GspL [Robiginitomaculum antarcticum]|uniref:type II secretion system protein GspL n=1 Tax=Robiginitomaculum antarcticum TaxID=437507 RepID=UPI00035CA8F8|nr:type II secretion system protein GspL [Robiginitomaculum antarcticum]
MSRGYLFVSENPDESWLWLDSGAAHGEQIEGAQKQVFGGTLTEPPIIVLPGQLVKALQLDLPKLRPAQMREAARFGAEDKLGSAAGQMHIALPKGDQSLTLACDRDMLAAQLSALNAASISPTDIYADFDLVAAGTAPVRFLEQVILSAPSAYTEDAGWDTNMTARANTVDATQIAALFNPSQATNLLQDDYAPRRALFGERAGQMDILRPVAAALLFTGIAALLFDISRLRAEQMQISSLRADTARLYTAATGETAPPDPARALRRSVDSGADISVTYARLSAIALSAVQATNGVQLENLRYDAGNNRLVLTLNYSAFETASAFQQAVAARGGNLSVGGVREQNGVLVGEAVLSGDAS